MPSSDEFLKLDDKQNYSRQRVTSIKFYNQLLFTFLKIVKQSFKRMELDELLSNYKGTLSVKDQKIFFNLKHYDHVNFNLINEYGYIEIGKSRKQNELNHKRIKNESVDNQDKKESNDKSVDADRLKRTDSLAKFLRRFKQPLIKSSIFSFPLHIELNKPIDHEQECLDPRFLLLSFHQLISRRKTSIDEFIDTNCLAITFVSLSFRDEQMRRLAYLVLIKFKQNLCSDSYGTIWRIILDKFAATLSVDNQQIPSLITSFLVHIIPFIKTPTYSIHEQLTNFLSNQSSFKFSSIVGFILSMLRMDDQESSLNQEVALLMLKNGIKSEMDFTLCLQSKLIDFLLINYNSSLLIKQNLKSKVLDIFRSIVRLPEASRLMCTEKAFLLWLNQLIVDENKTEILEKLNQIIGQLSELNFYPLFQSELKMIKNVCTQKIDHLFEQDLSQLEN